MRAPVIGLRWFAVALVAGCAKRPIDDLTGVPIEPSPIGAAFLDTLRRWIADGALDN